MDLRFVLLVPLTVAVCGCATMNPYVQHSRHVARANITACSSEARTPNERRGNDSISNSGGDPALQYACEMSIRLEKARAEIKTTRSSLTAAIYPLVGIVGYNSARGFNAPTNTALTAGGFAGYSAVTTLAQVDRIRIYDSGLKSIQCAIGTYEVATAGTPSTTVRNIALSLEADRINVNLASAIEALSSYPKQKQEIERLRTFVNAIKTSAEQYRPGRSQEAQLRQFVRNTVAKVNSQLTLTIPDNQQLIGNALSALQIPKGTTEKNGLIKFKIDRPLFLVEGGRPLVASLSNDHLGALENAVNGLWEMYQNLVDDAEAPINAIDFNACAYADINDAGFRGGFAPLQLGPNDKLAGKTSIPTPLRTVISGGVPPYTATVVNSTTSVPVKAEIDLTDGIPRLVVTAQEGASTGSHTIVVSDATNQQAKWLIVKVP